MEGKKKPKRSIPVAIKSKYPLYGPKNVANRIRQHSGSKSDKSPTADQPCKTALEVKGPFNPDIVAKFRNPNNQPRLRVRSSSETRKEKERKITPKCKDDLDIPRTLSRTSPPEPKVKVTHTHNPRVPAKRITRRTSAEDEARLAELESEKLALTGTMEVLKNRMHQYEEVMKLKKVDPACLKDLLLNEESINRERNEAVKSAEAMRGLLQQNLMISNTINQQAQEILAFTGEY